MPTPFNFDAVYPIVISNVSPEGVTIGMDDTFFTDTATQPLVVSGVTPTVLPFSATTLRVDGTDGVSDTGLRVVNSGSGVATQHLNAASPTQGGAVTTGTQFFSGGKNFYGEVTFLADLAVGRISNLSFANGIQIGNASTRPGGTDLVTGIFIDEEIAEGVLTTADLYYSTSSSYPATLPHNTACLVGIKSGINGAATLFLSGERGVVTSGYNVSNFFTGGDVYFGQYGVIDGNPGGLFIGGIYVGSFKSGFGTLGGIN